MTPQELLTYFSNQQKQLKRDIREMLMDSNVAIHSKIIDEVENLETKIDIIIKLQEQQSLKISKNDHNIHEMFINQAKIHTYQTTCPSNRIIKNWKSAISILVGVIILVNYVIQNVPWIEVFNVIKKIL